MRVRDGKSNTEADRIDVLFVQARVHCDNKPRQIGLDRDYNKTFSISHRECWYYPFKLRIWCSKREPFRVLPALLRHVVLVNNGNCRLTMPVDKGRCACDALPNTFDTCVFKTVKIIYHNKTYPQLICKHKLKVLILFYDAKKRIAYDRCRRLAWRIHGDARSPSLHTKLLDTGHMLPN